MLSLQSANTINGMSQPIPLPLEGHGNPSLDNFTK